MADLGSISYSIVFDQSKAKSSLSDIEAAANSMVERIRAKMAGLGFGGGGGAGGGGGGGGGAPAHTGSTTSTGQPTSTVTPIGGGSAASAAVANATAMNTGGVPGLNAAGGRGFAVGGVGGGGGVVAAVGGASTLGGMSTASVLRGAISGFVIKLALNEIANLADTAKHFNLAGSNQMGQAQALMGGIKGAISSVPLIGGPLATIATAGTEAYLEQSQRSMDIIRGENARGTGLRVGGIGLRAAGLSRQSYIRSALSSVAKQTAAAGSITQEMATDNIEFEKNQESSFFMDEKSQRQVDAKNHRELVAHNRQFTERLKQNTDTGEAERATIRRDAAFDIRIQNVQTRGQQLSNELRPQAGAAYVIANSALSGASYDLFERSQLPKGSPLLAESRAKTSADLYSAQADLGAQRTGILQNIYGGRPEEMSGMQSVEARRQVGSETNEDALRENTERMQLLIEAIRRVEDEMKAK